MEKVSKIHKIVATGFGSGYSPFAPGTAGAALAVILWYIASIFISHTYLVGGTFFCVILFTWWGIISSSAVEHIWGKDPSKVVIDEMVGVWIPLLVVPDNDYKYGYAVTAFILFRLFDIFKPLGIRNMEKFKGGIGIMMDDILSGIYSLIILIIIRCIAS